LEQSIKNILTTIDNAIATFQTSIPNIQKMVLDELQPLVKQLSVKNGNLLNSVENLKLIGAIKNKLERIIISANYKESVNHFIDSFTEISNLNNNYFKEFNKTFKPNKTLPIVKQLAVEATINDLIGIGLQSNFINPIQSILQQNITTGGSYANFVEVLQNHILNNHTGEGNLQRYTKQITTDAIHQYNAQYAEIIAQDLQFNWGRYLGSTLTTSREFCIFLRKKEWVHKSELPAIIKGHIDGQDCKLSKTTGLPLGMIPDTNTDNFKVRRGGYNCGDQFFWVPDSAVPADVKKKFENKGNLTKTNYYEEKQSLVEFKSEVSTFTKQNAVNICGGIPSNLINSKLQVNIIKLNGKINISMTSTQLRVIRILDNAQRSVENDLFRVEDKKVRGGTAINMFVNQVTELRKLGFKKMTVHAYGGRYGPNEKMINGDWDGHIVWGKFGYTMNMESKIKFDKHIKDNWKTLSSIFKEKPKSIFELVNDKEGAKWWATEGFNWYGDFDLKNNSENLKLLEMYLIKKKIIVNL
jgi:hypothetical protein